MTEETADYRKNPEYTMDEAKKIVTKKRDDADHIVQHPFREEADGENVEVVETMGLSVSSPTPSGVVTVQNTSSRSRVTSRFVAFDVDVIDDLIETLLEVKNLHNSEDTFQCPICGSEYDFPEEMNETDISFECPGCEYEV